MGSKSVLLPVREVAIMGIMDRLTDKEVWHKKVFDDAIVEKWREEATAIPDEEFMKVAAAPQVYHQERPQDQGPDEGKRHHVEGRV
jgi:hypothetical protein